MSFIQWCILVSILDFLFLLLILYLHHVKCKNPECTVNILMSWGVKK